MTRPTRFPIDHARKIVAEGIPYGPRLHPCVCGAGMHAHSGKNCTGACKATGCTRYRADLAYELAYQAIDGQRMRLGQALRAADKIARDKHNAARPVEPGQWRIGVSDLDSCRRAIWYRNLPPADLVRAWEDKREATMGTIIHDGAEAKMRVVFPWREFEQWVTVPGLDRDSRFDWYDPVILEAGDIKTAGEYRWDQLGLDGPTEETWDKILTYALALEESGRPVKTVRLDYIKRSNGHDEPFTRPYDRRRAEQARDRLVGYATALDILADTPGDEALLDSLMPRDGEGTTRDPLCKRCPFRLHCWNVPAADAAGRSPYSYTKLGPSPDDETVIWAIERKVEAAKALREAQAQVDETKDLLTGIRPGRYGGFEGYEKGGGKGPDYKGYADRLAAEYSKPEDERKPLEEIPGPAPQKYTYIQWGPVRKATLAKEAKEARTEIEGVA